MTSITTPIIINCPFSAQTINFPFLRTLREVLLLARRPVVLRMLANVESSLVNDALHKSVADSLGLSETFVAGVARDGDPSALGHTLVTYGFLAYPDYLNEMARAHLVLEPYFYGGCNTIVDALYAQLPAVSYQGDRWNNRIGTHILLQAIAGLSSAEERAFLSRTLVATHRQEFIERLSNLINDVGLLTEATRLVGQLSLPASLLADAASYHGTHPGEDGHVSAPWPEADYFPLALDYLLYLHERSERVSRRDQRVFANRLPADRLPAVSDDGPRAKLPLIRLRDLWTLWFKSRVPTSAPPSKREIPPHGEL